MNKAELVSAVTEEFVGEFTKKQIGEVLDQIVDKITDRLSNGEKVVVAKLGSFVVKDRKARTGRNPKTGEEIDIPAKKVVKFRACKELKEAVA